MDESKKNDDVETEKNDRSNKTAKKDDVESKTNDRPNVTAKVSEKVQEAIDIATESSGVKDKLTIPLDNFNFSVQEYSENTTIHGLKYLLESGRPVVEKLLVREKIGLKYTILLERFKNVAHCFPKFILKHLYIRFVCIYYCRTFWIAIMTTCAYNCFTLIKHVYCKWIRLPIIITYAVSQTSVSEIPFPAITICPSIKSFKNRFNYADIYWKKRYNHTITANEAKHFEYISLICANSPRFDFNTVTVGPEIINYMIQVGPHIEDYLLDMQWKGENLLENHTNPFLPVLTSEGFCYTFNMKDQSGLFTKFVKYPSDCFPSNGREIECFPETDNSTDSTNIKSQPRRTSTAGINGGFKTVFHFHKNEIDYTCGGMLQGFKVALHDPAEFPGMNENYFYIPFGGAAAVAVKPRVITTSIELKDYEPLERNCYYEHERNLSFFRRYKQQNCFTECLTNFTLALCKCAEFYMPKEKSTPICGAAARKCIDLAKGLFFETGTKYNTTKQLKLNLSEPVDDVKFLNYTENCDCLPDCYSINYDFETSVVGINSKEAFLALTDGNQVFEEESLLLAELNIFFKYAHFLPFEREQEYTYAQFMGDAGGILWLFVGFSFVTPFEALYYLVLRIPNNIRMFGCDQLWSEAEAVEEEDEKKD